MPSNIVVADRDSALEVATGEAAWTTFSSLEAGDLSVEDLKTLSSLLAEKRTTSATQVSELAAESTPSGPWAHVLDHQLVQMLGRTTQSERNGIVEKWIEKEPTERKLTQAIASRVLRTLARQCLTATQTGRCVYLRIATKAMAGTRELKRRVRVLEIYEDYAKASNLTDHQTLIAKALGSFERGEEPQVVPFKHTYNYATDQDTRMVQRSIGGQSYFGCERSVPMEAFTGPGASLTNAKPDECIIRSFCGIHKNALKLIETCDWKKLSEYSVKALRDGQTVGRTRHEDAVRGFVIEEESLADAGGAIAITSQKTRPNLAEMTIVLSKENDDFIRQQVTAGNYESPSAMIAAALQHFAVMI